MSLIRIIRCCTTLVVALLLVTSCSFHFELTSPRTALENQVLGDYPEMESLAPDASASKKLLSIYKQARGRHGPTGGQAEPLRKWQGVTLEEASNFQELDIRYLKDLQFIGEAKNGLLVQLPEGIGRISLATKGQRLWIRSLVRVENEYRVSLIANDSAKEESLSQNSFALSSFRAQILKKAQTGDWLENDRWEQLAGGTGRDSAERKKIENN